MVAIAYNDTYTADVIDITTRTPRPTGPVRAAKVPTKAPEHRPVGDPLIDATTRLLAVPMRQAYALLWRTGLLVVNG